MMKSSEFMTYMEGLFPNISFYNGSIDKNNPTCVGIYTRGRGEPNIALGGLSNTTYSTLPLSILVHWTESTEECNIMANSLYESLLGLSNVVVEGRRWVAVQLLDSSPVDINRDENNICEMVIRVNLVYER